MSTGAEIPVTTPADEATRELRRPRDRRMIAGVSAGLAAYFGLSPAIYRIAFAALALVGGAGILLYVVAALVIPAEGADQSIAEDFLRRHRDRPVLLIGLGVATVIAISAISSPGEWGWPLAGPIGLLLLLGVAGVAFWQVSTRDRGTAAVTTTAAAPHEPRRPSLFLPGLGVLLALGGLLALLEVADVVDVRFDVVLAVGIVLVGVLIAVGAFFRRASGLVLLGLVLLLALAGAAVADLGRGGPIGEREYSPATTAELRDEYNVRFGRLELDLRDLELPAGETVVEADVGMGELVVIVPDGVALDVTAEAGAGELLVLGRHEEDWSPHIRVVEDGDSGDAPRLVLDAEVGLGEIRVLRDPA